jgi:hypothetical protein
VRGQNGFDEVDNKFSILDPYIIPAKSGSDILESIKSTLSTINSSKYKIGQFVSISGGWAGTAGYHLFCAKTNAVKVFGISITEYNDGQLFIYNINDITIVGRNITTS